MGHQPLVRTLQRPAEHVVGSEQAVDAVEVGDDPGGQPCVDAVAQGGDALEVAADPGEIVVVPLLRGGEHGGGLAVVRLRPPSRRRRRRRTRTVAARRPEPAPAGTSCAPRRPDGGPGRAGTWWRAAPSAGTVAPHRGRRTSVPAPAGRRAGTPVASPAHLPVPRLPRTSDPAPDPSTCWTSGEPRSTVRVPRPRCSAPSQRPACHPAAGVASRMTPQRLRRCTGSCYVTGILLGPRRECPAFPRRRRATAYGVSGVWAGRA